MSGVKPKNREGIGRKGCGDSFVFISTELNFALGSEAAGKSILIGAE